MGRGAGPKVCDLLTAFHYPRGTWVVAADRLKGGSRGQWVGIAGRAVHVVSRREKWETCAWHVERLELHAEGPLDTAS